MNTCKFTETNMRCYRANFPYDDTWDINKKDKLDQHIKKICILRFLFFCLVPDDLSYDRETWKVLGTLHVSHVRILLEFSGCISCSHAPIGIMEAATPNSGKSASMA